MSLQTMTHLEEESKKVNKPTAFDKNITFYDTYIDYTGTTVEAQIKSYIESIVTDSIRYVAYNDLIKDKVSIPFHCYECKSPIDVDVSYLIKFSRNIDIQDFLCDKHKNTHVLSKNSVPFFRYESLFMDKFRKYLQFKF